MLSSKEGIPGWTVNLGTSLGKFFSLREADGGEEAHTVAAGLLGLEYAKS